MKVLKAEINWMRGWDNLPNLEIEIDQLPDMGKMVYRRWRDPLDDRWNGGVFLGQTMYWGEVPDDEGLVSFFTHNPSNERGYGGRTFNGKLTDGSEFAAKGPWSDNAMNMNRVFPVTSRVTVSAARDPLYPLRYAYHLRANLWLQLVKQAGGEVAVIAQYGGEDQEVGGIEAAKVIVKSERGESNGGFDFAIKLPGLTLAESQVEKNKGWVMGKREAADG